MDNNQLDIIVRAQNLASGELAALSGQLTGLEAKATSAGAAFNIMKLAVAAVAIGFVAVGVVAVKAAGDFQSGMTTLVTGAGEAEANIKMISAGILDMAVATGTTTKQLTDGMFMIESAGFHGAAGLEVLKAAAEGAKVGNADLGVVADATTTILNDFGSSGITASGAVNTLIATVANGKTHMADLANSLSAVLPVASAAGVGLNDVMGAMATMTGSGVDAANAAVYLRQTIIGLTTAGSKAQQALVSIGLSAEDVAAGMKLSLPKTLETITEALGKKFPDAAKSTTDEMAKVKAGTESFDTAMSNVAKNGGAQYLDTLKLIAGGSKTMQGLLDLTGSHLATFSANVNTISDSVTNAGNTINGWANVQGDFNFKMEQANELFQTTFIQIGTYLLPVLTQVVGGFVDWFGKIGGLNGILQTLHKTFAPVITGIMDFAKQVGDYLGPKLGDLWKTIQNSVIPTISYLWKNVIAPLIPIIGVVLVAAIGTVVDSFNNFLKAVGWIVNAIQTGNPIVIALTTAFVSLGIALGITQLISAVSAAFTIFTLVTMPAADLAVGTFVATVLAPLVMPAIAVGLALGAIKLVADAVAAVIRAIDAMNGLKAAQASDAAASVSLKQASDKALAAGTMTQAKYDSNMELVNRKTPDVNMTDKLMTGNATLGEWWNSLPNSGLLKQANGGYTGAGGFNEIAGIVHKGEYVVPQSQVDQGTGKPKNNNNMAHNSQTVTIQNVYLGSGDAVTKFFNKLDQDSILVGKGLTPNRGAY